MSEIDPQEFGKLQATVQALEKDMSTMKDDIRVIRDAITEARGGWRMLLLLIGAAGTAGALVTWAIQHIEIRW